MAPWGLPGSAVLSAAVFVGGAVSSPLVAPGECVVRAGAPGAESGLHAEGREPAAPPRPELRASCSATGSGSEHLGVPGWPGQGAARGAAWVPPHPPPRLPPSLPRLFGGPRDPNPNSSEGRLAGASSPQPRAPGARRWTPFLPS